MTLPIVDSSELVDNFPVDLSDEVIVACGLAVKAR